MLARVLDLLGLPVAAPDGRAGRLDDVYFDDHGWTVRHLVVDVGHRAMASHVLLPPDAVRAVRRDAGELCVGLTAAGVRGLADAHTDEPVALQCRLEPQEYFTWPSHAERDASSDAGPVGARRRGDPHLRSVRAVAGYLARAVDGEIGHVEDFILDDAAWVIRYVVVDTRTWWPGKRVLVAAAWVSWLSWIELAVHADLCRDAIRGAPEYDPTRPVERADEARLYRHYGRPAYWEEAAGLATGRGRSSAA